MFRFIHCADLHLGSPFAAWRKLRPETARELALAPFAAFDRLADTAIENKALFMVLAGDVFDSSAPTLYAEGRFLAALERLNAAGIRVFWAPGNHDCGAMREGLPANTVRFSSERAECFPIEAGGRVVASVAGIGHGAPDERRDLVPQLIPLLAAAAGFRVGVLHANIDGVPGYEPYAPAPLAELENGPADYWALGHIHKRRVLCEKPFAVYSGSAQGRSVNEPGARGGVLVEVDDAGSATLRMLDVQPFRFETLTLDRLAEATDTAALTRLFAAALPACKEPLCLRLVLKGGCPLNARLRAVGGAELEELFAPVLRSRLPRALLESVVVDTTAPPSASRREGLAAEVAAVRGEVDPGALLAAMSLKGSEFSGFGAEELAEIGREAEELLLDYLAGDLEAVK
jgi:DNA repair exonuclease SbcCD nuclease subunit